MPRADWVGYQHFDASERNGWIEKRTEVRLVGVLLAVMGVL